MNIMPTFLYMLIGVTVLEEVIEAAFKACEAGYASGNQFSEGR